MNRSMAEEKKKVDEEWKQKVQESKEEVAEEAEAAEEEPMSGPLPEPSFSLLVSGLASQVFISLGEVENPGTKKKEKNLDQAKYTIDMLNILEEKTKGNLASNEKQLLDSLLYDLRMRYVRACG